MNSNLTIGRFTATSNVRYDLGSPLALAIVVAVLIFIAIQARGSRRNANGPPVVTSWIPYLGSADAIDRNPDAFIAAAKKKHPGGVFGVKIAGHVFYYITDVKLINAVYRQPKIFSMSSVSRYWAKRVFGISDNALYGSNAYPLLGQHFHRSIAPKNIGVLVETFASELYSLIHCSNEIGPTVVGESIISPFLEFTYRAVYISTSRMLFGPTWDTSDEAIAVFDAFDIEVYKASGGYPPALMPTFSRGRKDIKSLIHKYISGPSQPGQLIAEQLEIARDAGWDEDDLSTLVLGALWPMMANVPFSAYWVIVLCLQHADGVQPLIEELDAAGSRFISQNSHLKGPYTDHLAAFFQSDPALPLFASTISETLRYTTDSYSMREVIVDEVQLGSYVLKRGDTTVCVTRGVHMDKSEFGENAEEWVPRRFMRDAPNDEDKKGLSGKETEFNWMPFGGGISMCSGRYFAKLHMKIAITTLLKTFRFEVDPTKGKVKLGRFNRGFGIRRPEGDLMVKITRL